jgi:hypothetical protein
MYFCSNIFLLGIFCLSGCSLNGTQQTMNRLDSLRGQLEKLDSYAQKPNQLATNVSKWSVYHQIEHILLTNNKISELIEKGVAPEQIKSRTLPSYFIFAIGYLIRGFATAPELVIPNGVSQLELVSLLKLYEEHLEKIKLSNELDSDLVVGNHPYFGGLNRSEWIRFMEIHTNHHLKIINDIKHSSTQ